MMIKRCGQFSNMISPIPICTMCVMHCMMAIVVSKCSNGVELFDSTIKYSTRRGRGVQNRTDRTSDYPLHRQHQFPKLHKLIPITVCIN